MARGVEAKRTGDNNVLVVGDKVLNQAVGALLDISITPVHPRMLGLQCGVEQVVARLGHGLAARSLGGIGMSFLDILAQLVVEVLDNHGGASEGDLVGAALDAVQLGGKGRVGVVFRVGDEEGKVNQVVRIGQLGQQVKVLGQVLGGVLEGRQDEDSLFVGNGLCGGGDGIQIDIVNGGRVELDRGVVVIENGCLQVTVPSGVLIRRHVHWRLGRSPAVEAACAGESAVVDEQRA